MTSSSRPPLLGRIAARTSSSSLPAPCLSLRLSRDVLSPRLAVRCAERPLGGASRVACQFLDHEPGAEMIPAALASFSALRCRRLAIG